MLFDFNTKKYNIFHISRFKSFLHKFYSPSREILKDVPDKKIWVSKLTASYPFLIKFRTTTYRSPIQPSLGYSFFIWSPFKI